MATKENIEYVPRFGVADDKEITKLRQNKNLPGEKWFALVGLGATIKENPKTGKFGINLRAAPLPALDADEKSAKRRYSVFISLLAWFKDPSNKARKPADTFGIWDGYVSAVTTLEKGKIVDPALPYGSKAMIPPRIIRLPDSDVLGLQGGSMTLEEIVRKGDKDVGIEKYTGKDEAGLAKAIKDAAARYTLVRDRWLREFYDQCFDAAEKKVKPHPLAGLTFYGKTSLSEWEGNTYCNVGSLRSELPEGAELYPLDQLGKGEDEEEDEIDETDE